jgi:hypothetical protein
MRIIALMAAVLALAPSPVSAQNAPKQLYGKSVVATWSEDRLQRVVGEAQFRNQRIAQGVSVYVSATGNIFVRATGGGSRRTGKSEAIGAASKSERTVGGRRFDGRTLVMSNSFASGAKHVSIEFDEGFSTCRVASIIWGKAPGSDVVRLKVLTGENMEIRSSISTGMTCSVQAGNVFAN